MDAMPAFCLAMATCCCTVSTPRHPATHPKMDKILEGESHLDEEALIQRALEGTEVIRV